MDTTTSYRLADDLEKMVIHLRSQPNIDITNAHLFICAHNVKDAEGIKKVAALIPRPRIERLRFQGTSIEVSFQTDSIYISYDASVNILEPVPRPSLYRANSIFSEKTLTEEVR